MKLKNRIKSIISCLTDGLYERDEVISVSFLSALADQNIFLYGPPGTAKSLISRRLSHAFETDNYFEYLMQKFSTPEEVFGPISISELKKDNYIRKIHGYLPTCEFAFLDEIWKSSPAILNTLLTLINEKVYKNGSHIEKVPLKVLISASNETPPKGQGLEALYDRFLTRLYVPPTSERKNFELLLNNGGTNSEISIPENLKIKNEEWEKWKEEINSVKLSNETLNIINAIRLELFEKNKLESFDVYVSDRRWQRAAIILKASAFFCDRNETNIADTLLLSHCLWTTKENKNEIIELVEKCVEDSGFETDFSIKTIDDEKDKLEKEISKEIFYSKDIYETFKLNDKKEYFKCKISLKSQIYGREPKVNHEIIYIPFEKMKSTGEFNPIDENGNKLNYIKYEFKNQGTCSIKYNAPGKIDNWYHDNHWEKLSDFKPILLFHKGDRKEEVNTRLLKSLNLDTKKLTKKIENIIKTIENKKNEFLKELDNPFILDEKIQIALKSINVQLEDIKLRHKDCERLLSMVAFEENNIE